MTRLEEIIEKFKDDLRVYHDENAEVWLGDLDYLIQEAKLVEEYEDKLNKIERIVDKNPYTYNAIYEVLSGKSVIDTPSTFGVIERTKEVKLPKEGKAKPKFYDDWND